MGKNEIMHESNTKFRVVVISEQEVRRTESDQYVLMFNFEIYGSEANVTKHSYLTKLKIHYTILSFYQRKDYSGGSIEKMDWKEAKRKLKRKTKRLLKSSEK